MTSQTTDAKAWLYSRASKHLTRTARTYKFVIWDGAMRENMLGTPSIPKAFEGKFLEQDDQFMLFKERGSRFLVLATALASGTPSPNDSCIVKFYEQRDFAGLASDGHEDPQEPRNDGIRCMTFTLSGTSTQFPVKWDKRRDSRSALATKDWKTIQNPYLQDLIGQLEGIKVDPWRTIADLLVYAKGKELVFTDPPEDESYSEDPTQWPAVAMQVSTAKFTGHLTIRYDRANDTYEILLKGEAGEDKHFENVHFPDLAPKLMEHVDDGTWQLGRIEVVGKAKKTKAVLATEATN